MALLMECVHIARINTLQHAATHCDTPQQIATLQHTFQPYNTATHTTTQGHY